jgi:carbon-monoxide dehydrogenase medium subunit
MKAAPFSYHAPSSVDEAVGLLGRLEDAKILAGGQSLVAMMNMRFVQPSHVIDINGLDDLAAISRADGAVGIGAMTRQAALMQSDVIARDLPVMADALAHVGHFQTRNRGTIGGSLCHLDPAAELAAVAALYDAEITVAGGDGTRVVPFAEWPLGYMMPSLAPEELATEITFPLWPAAPGHAFVEFSRRHGDFAIVAVGCLMAVDAAGAISRVAIAVAGADQVVRRLAGVEAALVGETADAGTLAEASRLAGEMNAMDDAHVSAGYRQRLARVLTERALGEAARRAGAGARI